MIKLIRFRTDENIADSETIFVNPVHVAAIWEESDDFTRIYTTNSHDYFVVYGTVQDVAAQLDGTAERNREAYG